MSDIATRPSRTAAERMLPVAAALDAASVMVFIAAGRRTHEQDPGIAGLLHTAAPFLLALALGWIVTRAWQRPAGIRTGLGIWAVTFMGGMVLRNLVFDRGTAMAFVLVAGGFTFACLIGWRLIAAAVTRSRRTP